MMASSAAMLARSLGRAARRLRGSGGGDARSLSTMPGSNNRHSFQPNTQQRRRPSSSLGSLNYPHVAPDPLADPTVFDDINTYSCKRQTGVSLKTLLDTGRGHLLQKKYFGKEENTTASQQMLQQVACFLHRELPIRLAHRVRDLDAIPVMREMPSIQLVKTWYVKSFHELRNTPTPNTVAKEADFAVLLKNIYERHAPVLLTMARGAYELRQKYVAGSSEFYDLEVHNFLDAFYLSRIGIRMLIGQYLELREPPKPDYIGLCCLRTSPRDVALTAIEDAKYMCTRQHGDAPEVTLHGRLDLTFAYVSEHVHYILLELLKNSMRATAEFHGTDDMPPIRIVIADGEDNEDVVIKVSDEGGGIPRSHISRIWSYLFTTADPEIQRGFVDLSHPASDFDTASPLAGLGYGLPISRAYARYFGGDLSIMSMEGYGTDAFVHLSRLGNHDEPLP
ncbi:pyruvate dehydrogenase kinase [Nannochloropsis oceanica]